MLVKVKNSETALCGLLGEVNSRLAVMGYYLILHEMFLTN